MPKTATPAPIVISPTVGRIVWFWPHSPGGDQAEQPLAAIVCFVFNDRMVNLAVFDHNGVHKNHTSVPLAQEGDTVPDAGYYCQWMPYQLGQAVKHAADDAAASKDGAGK